MTSSLAVRETNGSTADRRSYSKIPSVLDVPNLIQVQLQSFEWLKTDGLADLLDEVSPIEDLPGGRFALTLEDHYFEDPKYTEEGVQREGDHLQRPSARYRQASNQGRWPRPGRGQGADPVHRRHPHDDQDRHLHHQRGGAGRRKPAGQVAGGLLYHHGGPGNRQDAVVG